MVETFIIAAQSDQSIDSLFAFAKSFMLRGLAAGAVKEGLYVKIFMLPASAARYAKSNPTYEHDREAVLESIKSAGYTLRVDGPASPDAKEPAPLPTATGDDKAVSVTVIEEKDEQAAPVESAD